jgi:sec-independent protein translocase protein TatC
MTLLAAPVLLLISIATGIAWLNDRRRGRHKQDFSKLSDDQVSPEPTD